MRQRISIMILAICFCLSMGIFAACEKGGTEEKGKYDMSEVAWNYPADGYVYDGSEKTVALTGLPSGVTATYSGDVTESEVGNYTATATFVYDEENYELVNVPEGITTLEWTIREALAPEKGKYDMSEVAWNYPADGYVYDGSEKTVALTGLPSGVTATYSGDVTESEVGNYTATATFVYDEENYELINVPEGITTLEWTIAANQYHAHSGITFDKILTSEGGALSDGNYCLTDDVALTNNLTISGTVTLCLNGHILMGNGEGSVITLEEDAVFTLYDCGIETVHYYTVDANGVFVFEGVTETTARSMRIDGGVVTGGTANSGGGVYAQAGSVFTLNGGNISGNSSSVYGGGIYSAGKVIINNGSVSGNVTSMYGGGVQVNGMFEMHGGKIFGNTSNVRGCAVYVSKGCSFTMTDGEIGKNYSSSSYAINIYVTDAVNDGATGVISGGYIAAALTSAGNYDRMFDAGEGLTLQGGCYEVNPSFESDAGTIAAGMEAVAIREGEDGYKAGYGFTVRTVSE